MSAKSPHFIKGGEHFFTGRKGQHFTDEFSNLNTRVFEIWVE